MFVQKGFITQMSPDETLMCLADTNGHRATALQVINKKQTFMPSVFNHLHSSHTKTQVWTQQIGQTHPLL